MAVRGKTEKANRLYDDLSWLWPLWGTVDEYKRESELFARLVKRHSGIPVRTLLDITCGGGKNDFHFKRWFEVTGLDISKKMLALARKLNPECAYVLGDMRGFDLGKQFDSVLMNDGIVYMASEEDLIAAFRSAFRHLRTGGVLLAYVEAWKETFHRDQKGRKRGRAPAPYSWHNATRVSAGESGSTIITFVEHDYDPDRSDDSYESAHVYLIRKGGELRIEADVHTLGLFSIRFWRRALKMAGFEIVEEDTFEDGLPIFVCRKP
ncbi:MAG: class I SAM-dependent methyltransferase [Euryarchaeota archaeon]|nr:class I SAM-dependent methyltransferase [Euryarchaeota archaeon]